MDTYTGYAGVIRTSSFVNYVYVHDKNILDYNLISNQLYSLLSLGPSSKHQIIISTNYNNIYERKIVFLLTIKSVKVFA